MQPSDDLCVGCCFTDTPPLQLVIVPKNGFQEWMEETLQGEEFNTKLVLTALPPQTKEEKEKAAADAASKQKEKENGAEKEPQPGPSGEQPRSAAEGTRTHHDLQEDHKEMLGSCNPVWEEDDSHPIVVQCGLPNRKIYHYLEKYLDLIGDRHLVPVSDPCRFYCKCSLFAATVKTHFKFLCNAIFGASDW